ncbi:hypothetical protein AB6D11_18730 [Vibrio splendidus]
MVKRQAAQLTHPSVRIRAWEFDVQLDIRKILEMASMWRDHCRDGVEFGFMCGLSYLSVDTLHNHRHALRADPSYLWTMFKNQSVIEPVTHVA